MRDYRKYFIGAAVLVAAGLFFKLALLGYSFIAYVLFAFAAVCLFFAFLRYLRERNSPWAKGLKVLFFACAAIFAGAFAVTEGFIIAGASSEGGEDGEYAIVLGAGVNGTEPSRSLWARLKAALEYYGENPDVTFIVSGGQGGGEDITEAECMYRWLTEHGVPSEQVIKEERATSTEENLAFSRDIILSRDPEFTGTVTVISESYHLLRARLMAEDAGFCNIVVRGGYTGLPILAVNYYIREAVAVWYYLLVR